MSVNKTSSGRWEARWRDASGTSRAKTFRLKEDATKHERDQIAARDRGDWVDPASLKLTFKEYAEQWRKVQNHRPNTLDQIDNFLTRHIYPTFGDRRLRGIRPTEIKAWHAGLALAPSTRKVAYSWVSTIFKAAMQDRILPVSPCQLRLPSKSKDTAPLECLTVEQVAILVSKVAPRYQAAIVFAAGSGLRPGEWTGLTLDRVDFLRRTVKVDRQLLSVKEGLPIFGPPKSAAGFRTVPLSEGVCNALSTHVATFNISPGELLFTTSTGRPIRSSSLTKVWHKGADGHLPKWATPHDLRHFYASCLINAGCNVKQVQRALGHESAVVTLDVYSHLWVDNDDDLRKAVQGTMFAEADEIDEQIEGTTTL